MTDTAPRAFPDLVQTARALVGAGRGVLAMDESIKTCDARLLEAGLPATEAMRLAWRELIVGVPGLGDYISGAILCDETMRQATRAGVPFPRALTAAGIIVGVKVDVGATPLAAHPGERVTEGLDGLRGRLSDYRQMGARFAKWRAVITIGEGIPSRGCLAANAQALARYAALCQEADLVPIVEPEVLAGGTHALERCRSASEAMLEATFEQLRGQGVALEAMILKPNMVTAGLDSDDAPSVAAVAEATVTTLLRAAPAAVAGIAFLSGGPSGPLACARLNAMNRAIRGGAFRAPWPLTFSFARAIQHPALNIWRGQDALVAPAQAALRHRAHCAWAAIHGQYDAALEAAAAEPAAA
jgi:fructose-bisphosphate aldolase class I